MNETDLRQLSKASVLLEMGPFKPLLGSSFARTKQGLITSRRTKKSS
jgi:hypothetical protein